MKFPRISNVVKSRSHSTSIFSWNTITSKLPPLKITSKTTLGEIWEVGFVKYKYRAAYPVIAWIGFLYYNLWTPYAPETQKKVAREKEEHLANLAFKQE